MNITKSLTFYLDDPRRWEKLGVGTAVVLISSILLPVLVGIVGYIILTGYAIRLLQNVRDGQEHPLPEWDRWSEDLAVGFKYGVAILVYALPMMVLWIPATIGAAMTDSSRGAGFIGVPLMVLGFCLIFLYGLFLTVATPAITIAFARDEEIRSAFNFTAIWEWTRAHIGPVVVVSLVYLAASFVLAIGGAIVGALLCIVGLIVTIPLATLLTTLVQYHLYGQLAHDFGAPVAGAFAGPATPLLPAPYETRTPAAPVDAAPAQAEDHVTYVAPSSPADFADAAPAPLLDDEPVVQPVVQPVDQPVDQPGDQPVAPPEDQLDNEPLEPPMGAADENKPDDSVTL